MTRGTTWSNSDGLVVGFGPNVPERLQAAVIAQEGTDTKIAKLSITFASTFGSRSAKVTIPANSLVKNVYMKVGTAWAGGTSLAFGDTNWHWFLDYSYTGSNSQLTAGVAIQAQGAYAFTATEGQLVPKVYATSLDLFVTAVGTFTAGTADIYVEYV
jgi:hypothetical protein